MERRYMEHPHKAVQSTTPQCSCGGPDLSWPTLHRFTRTLHTTLLHLHATRTIDEKTVLSEIREGNARELIIPSANFLE